MRALIPLPARRATPSLPHAGLIPANLTAVLVLLVAAVAVASPPEDGGGEPSRAESGGGGISGGGVGFGGFVPPPGAQYDPSTSSDPGLLDQPRTQVQDQTYGPTGAGDRIGYDVVDASSWEVQTGWNDQVVPDYHIVQEGDSLSAICAYYYGDMYLWPKIWSYNPNITNAHWIFPGDRIRLTDPYETVSGGPEGEGLLFAETYDPRDDVGETYLLERYAFIDEDDLAKSMEVTGGATPAVLMGTLDTAYISYQEENPPIPGERLSVYIKKQPVYDIKVKGKNQKQKKGKRIGWLVEVVGEVYVHSVAEKSAEAEIVDSVQPVERGYRVGELKTRFARVQSAANEVTANGLVVEHIREMTISGETQFVIVNLGAEDGIRRGNTMEVVQKGDAYTTDHRLHQPYDKGHPRRVLAHLLVLQIEGDSALAVVTYSVQEIVIGDHVEITAAGEEPEDHDPYDADKREQRRGEADGEVKADDGSVEAEGSLRVGG
jgi:hypothetical protein